MPPLQKAGLVMVGAAVGGGLSVATNYANSALTGTSGTSSNSNIDNNISKLIGDSQLSPLQGVLSSLEIIDYACLAGIYILIIQLISKLYLGNSVNLNFSGLLGNNFNNKIEYYLNKIIKLNKQMSIL
jgi:hypothetical protein